MRWLKVTVLCRSILRGCFRTLPRYAGGGLGAGPASVVKQPLSALLCMFLAAIGANAQKWVNPQFDAHRLDYRDLGYPDVNAIDADNCPITALLATPGGKIYGATSGKSSVLFLYDRAINKVRPLGAIGDAKGVHHALVADRDGSILIGGGLNQLAPVPLKRDFPGGYRAIEEQLWKDIQAPYANYTGGHLYRYHPSKSDAGNRLPDEPCPLEDLGIPVKANSIYAMALDTHNRRLYGITYPDARFFVHHLDNLHAPADVGPVFDKKIYAGPERHWRSVPRALFVADDGRVYTSGDDGRILCYDPKTQKLERTVMQIPGEYWEAWNYYGCPVVECFARDAKGNIYGASSDGFLFRMDLAEQKIANLGKPRVGRRVRAMSIGPDERLYMLCGEWQDVVKLFSYDLTGKEGFRDWGVLAVDRSPYYAKRAYQFDAMTTGIDGTIFLGESDRRAGLFLFVPGGKGFEGGFNPANPR